MTELTVEQVNAYMEFVFSGERVHPVGDRVPGYNSKLRPRDRVFLQFQYTVFCAFIVGNARSANGRLWNPVY
jgi:hypothetical protein